MSMRLQRAKELLKKYQKEHVKYLFAQSNASYVLHEVGEPVENFPNFDVNLTNKITFSAYSILAAGVNFAENQLVSESVPPLEEAAQLLINIHGPHADTDHLSSFHVLIASMAFYAAGQYSQAYIYLKKAEPLTPLAKIIESFIRKKTNEVITLTNQPLLEDLANISEEWWKLCDHAITLIISRSISFIQEFFATGNRTYFLSSIDNLKLALELASDFNSPSHWWVVRLLKLMIIRVESSSLWTVLPSYFPENITLLNKYISYHNFADKVVTQLWHSQLRAVPIVLDFERSGAIVNMRTSSGKTRVAELAILQTLHKDPNAKILYLAPFRSLAFEVEHALSQIFETCGFSVSHLYGGFRASSVDRLLVEESSITIATPEKIRAMLRAFPEFSNKIKLIIIDEGHLIGEEDRYIKNEIFINHLKLLAMRSECRMVLLSAVLPNPDELALWLTGDRDNVARSEWKPSSERFGTLVWQGTSVHINWKGEYPAFNKNFITQKKYNRQYDHNQKKWKNRQALFPNNKKEAVADTAIRLSSVGPVMIFSARANSIPSLACAVLTAIGEDAEHYNWPKKEWDIFCAICEEDLQDGAIELIAAQKGIICHSDKLPPQVRIATESLVRSMPPKVIIASTTLAQGVNIGVSSVIISTPYQSEKKITNRDFWNICGRAGRAFVDGEGKILYAIDATQERWKIQKQLDCMKSYFEVIQQEPVKSGLLFVLEKIYKITQSYDIEFEHLIEMISEDDFSKFENEDSEKCKNIMELISDSLLALYDDSQICLTSNEPEILIDNVFRNSLAAIQSDNKAYSISADEIIKILTTKTKQLIQLIPNESQRKAYVASGLPITIASNIFKELDMFVEQVELVQSEGKSFQSILSFLEWLEEWARINAIDIVKKICDKNEMDIFRKAWISAVPLREMSVLHEHYSIICKDVYGVQLPWLIHAIAQQLKQNGYDALSNTLASIALVVELGVPSERAAWVFLAGVRSRVVATEIASCDIDIGNSANSVRYKLRNGAVIATLHSQLSEKAKVWLEIYTAQSNIEQLVIPKFTRFTLPLDKFPNTDTVLVRSYDNGVYLCSPDGQQKMLVKTSDKWPFDTIANDYRFAFIKSSDGKYDLVSRDFKVNLTSG